MKDIHTYTIKLIRYVLKGDVPELPENIDFELLYEFSKSHGVENMIYVGLRDLKIEVPEPTMQKFKEAYEMAIMVEAMQAIELEQISNAFEEAGIDHIPLKGSVIKYLYPDPSYRKSGDIDILIKPEDEPIIDSVMTASGYERETYMDGYEVHFSYLKRPFIEVEIHRKLIRTDNRAHGTCKHAWKNVFLCKGFKHKYKFSNEFFYMHLLAHLCNHMYEGGAGIRLITDFYIMNNRTEIVHKKLNQIIKKANLTEIHNMVNNLVEKWFANDYISDKNTDMLEQIIFISGNFGNREMREIVRNSDSLWGRVMWTLKRVIPPFHRMQFRYPVLNKRPYLLPVFWVYRFFDLALMHRDVIAERKEEHFNKNKRNDNITDIVMAVKNR